MKIASALAVLSLAALAPSAPVSAQKVDKGDNLPRCKSTTKKRAANLYGTVLPSIPARSGVAAVDVGTATAPAAAAPTMNLFPAPSDTPTVSLNPPAEVGGAGPTAPQVPAIGAALPEADRSAALATLYASC